jgi:integrase/recombinase XerD
MAVTGMRVGEAIALDREDVDARNGLLRIIDSKFGKSREVALHASAMEALAPTASCATGCARARAARRSSSRPPAPDCSRHAFTVCSLAW